MRRASLPGLLSVVLVAGGFAASTPSKTTTVPGASSASRHGSLAKSSSSRKGKRSRKSRSGRKRGQQAIDSSRARQIQQALIREHYMEGKPSGKWDDATQAALRRYQSDQGWQSKTVPDSRALIKLGLGPSVDGLLNPESAMTSAAVPANAKGDTKLDPAETSATPRTLPADNPQP